MKMTCVNCGAPLPKGPDGMPRHTVCSSGCGREWQARNVRRNEEAAHRRVREGRVVPYAGIVAE